MIAPLPPGHVRTAATGRRIEITGSPFPHTFVPPQPARAYIDRSADDDTAMRARFAPFGDNVTLAPADEGRDGGLSCGSDLPVTLAAESPRSPSGDLEGGTSATGLHQQTSHSEFLFRPDDPTVGRAVRLEPPHPDCPINLSRREAQSLREEVPTGRVGFAHDSSSHFGTAAAVADNAGEAFVSDDEQQAGPMGPMTVQDPLTRPAASPGVQADDCGGTMPTCGNDKHLGHRHDGSPYLAQVDDGRTEELRHELIEAMYACRSLNYETLADALIAGPIAPLLAATTGREDDGAVQRVLEPFEELFSGDPDTTCRTTWRKEPGWSLPGASAALIECVEVPMDDLRDAFDRAHAATGDPT